MSYNSNNHPNVKKKQKSKAAKKKIPGSNHDLDSSEAFWSEADVQAVVGLIVAVTYIGGAVMFSKSSDGGALGYRVYHDDHEVKTVWGRVDATLDEKLRSDARYYAEYENEEGTA